MKTVVIPMAGLGSRFTKAGFDVHKPLIKVGNKTLIRWSIDSLGLDNSWKLVIVARDLGGNYRTEVTNEIPEADIIWIDKLTSGATETALVATDYVDLDDELIITNCDQYLDWNVNEFLKCCNSGDGAVLTYHSTDNKNSFCVTTNNNQVVEMVEKQAVSDKALVGVHWWKKARDFIVSAQLQVENKTADIETYISESYNTLINQGKNILAVPINGNFWPIGTPEDLSKFKGYISEYSNNKPQTFFIDLDGTVLEHGHKYSILHKGQNACTGVVEALDELDSLGHTIILCSARKESARQLTERLLESLGIPYDQLILGITQGCRVVVNDIPLENSKPRAKAINVICNKGWNSGDLL